jgi:plastocyanin
MEFIDRMPVHTASLTETLLVRPLAKTVAVGAVAAAALVAPQMIQAQSLLDRPDNISTDWVGNTGTLYFNFVHRFSQSPPPERKVTNFPTFLIATGVASKALVGVNYATNSGLAARYPNEWEFFGRYSPLQQEEGAPIDVGAQVDYNLAVKGVDGELSIARREGPVRLVGVSRMIGDTLGGSRSRFAFGGGGTLRFGRFLAISGDALSLTKREAAEKVAWSAGLHIALPNTPHTLSLHVSNASTSTLQGFTRGGDTRRYGFEFTIPIHVRRFFSSPEPITTPPIRVDAPALVDSAVPPRAVPTNPPVADSAKPPTIPPPTPTPTTPARTTPADTAAAAKPPTQPPTPPPAAAGGAPRPAPTAARPPAQRPAAPAAAAPKVFTARMKGQAYLPDHVEISAGTTVRWRNLDALIHTVTATDKSFDSGVIGADGSYSHTFSRPGTYSIYCLAHPFMKATIVVK